jgi:HD domain
MQAQQAILTFDEAERSLGGRLLKVAIEIDRVEGYSEPHAIAIAWTAEKVGARMGLHGVDLTALKFAALAHDLGERAMKRDYLLRPRALSWEETLDLWRHPILGEQAAGELKLSRHTQLLIRWHHEWWNGGGYPDGLAGKSIPLGARILRAVDSYFALISDRPHRRRFDRIEAEQIIADLAGIEFDPQVVKMLLQVLAEEEASEPAFVYPAPEGDEAVSRMGEDQPQPLDEIVYATAYATRQAEIPAEPSGGGQSAAPDFGASRAPDRVMDEAVIESHAEMAAVDFASSVAANEVEAETRPGMAVADFTSSNAIEEAGIEVQTGMAGADLASSETPDEVMAGGRMEMARHGLTSPIMLGATELESLTKMTTTDFTSSEAPGEAGIEAQPEMAASDFASSEGLGEGLDKAGVEAQPEMAGAETQITREKLES